MVATRGDRQAGIRSPFLVTAASGPLGLGAGLGSWLLLEPMVVAAQAVAAIAAVVGAVALMWLIGAYVRYRWRRQRFRRVLAAEGAWVLRWRFVRQRGAHFTPQDAPKTAAV